MKFAKAARKIAKTFSWSVPGTVFGIVLVAFLGVPSKFEACNFVRSAACVVVFMPEMFDCDFAWKTYTDVPPDWPAYKNTVYAAESDTETSIGYLLQTFPMHFLVTTSALHA